MLPYTVGEQPCVPEQLVQAAVTHSGEPAAACERASVNANANANANMHVGVQCKRTVLRERCELPATACRASHSLDVLLSIQMGDALGVKHAASCVARGCVWSSEDSTVSLPSAQYTLPCC